MKTALYLVALTAIAWAVRVEVKPRHVLNDFWIEPRAGGLTAVPCGRVRELNPFASLMKLLRLEPFAAMPGDGRCSAENVRFRPMTHEESAAQVEGFAALFVLGLASAAALVHFETTITRRLKCRNPRCSGSPAPLASS